MFEFEVDMFLLFLFLKNFEFLIAFFIESFFWSFNIDEDELFNKPEPFLRVKQLLRA